MLDVLCTRLLRAGCLQHGACVPNLPFTCIKKHMRSVFRPKRYRDFCHKHHYSFIDFTDIGGGGVFSYATHVLTFDATTICEEWK